MKIIIKDENFKWHLEAFASELFIYIYIDSLVLFFFLFSFFYRYEINTQTNDESLQFYRKPVPTLKYK